MGKDSLQPRSFIIIGTDTDVGKTVVSAVVVGLLGRRGHAVDYLKPLGTGTEDSGEGPVSPDAVFIREKTGLETPYSDLCPVTAVLPAAPAQSLLAEGRDLDYPALIETCRSRLKNGKTVVVEGVGGLMVPIGAGKLLSDLVVDLALPVMVVARPGLGTINHTLLTLNQLDRLGASILGFLFSGPGDEQSGCDNARWITEFHPAPYLGWLPDYTGLDWAEFLDRSENRLKLPWAD